MEENNVVKIYKDSSASELNLRNLKMDFGDGNVIDVKVNPDDFNFKDEKKFDETMSNLDVEIAWFLQCIIYPISVKHKDSKVITRDDIYNELTKNFSIKYFNNYLDLDILIDTDSSYTFKLDFKEAYPNEAFNVCIRDTMKQLKELSKSNITVDSKTKKIMISYNHGTIN